MKNSAHVENIEGFDVIVPNTVFYWCDDIVNYCGKEYEGFYISYNSYDAHIYGSDTTALVLGQMQKFFILNGNHIENYKKIAKMGFFKCLEYFLENIEQTNKFSD